MFQKISTTVIPALIGALTAITITTFLSRDDGPVRAARPAPSKSEPGDSAVRAPRDVGVLMAQSNRQRLRAIEESLDRGDDQAQDGPDQVAIEESDPEQRREQLYRDWEGALSEHDAEPYDRAWAAEVEPKFSGDLDAMSQGAFRTVGVECNSTSCAASVEFPSFEQAKQGFGPLLHHIYQVNCRTRTVLEEPEDPGAAYVATVLFDCARSRERG